MATICQVLQLGHSTLDLGSVKRPAQQHTMLDMIHACCHTRKLGVHRRDVIQLPAEPPVSQVLPLPILCCINPVALLC